jgi:hypothetical protein
MILQYLSYNTNLNLALHVNMKRAPFNDINLTDNT